MTNYKKIIILGAPRSGTNILRDTLTSSSGVTTWPCDEINLLWRYGNALHPDDEFSKKLVKIRTKNYVNRSFDRLAERSGAHAVVEKTCANCLRPEFVENILDEPTYVYIYRNGLDVVGSAKIRWRARVDLKYLVAKLRFVPIMDMPIYFYKFLKNRYVRLVAKDRAVGTWGPIFKGMYELKKNASLNVVCAVQWIKCCEKAEEFGNHIGPERFYKLSYEDFVTKPMDELKKLLKFLDISLTDVEIQTAISNISNKSIGKGQGNLSPNEIEELLSLSPRFKLHP